jgi:hypothetical protein
MHPEDLPRTHIHAFWAVPQRPLSRPLVDQVMASGDEEALYFVGPNPSTPPITPILRYADWWRSTPEPSRNSSIGWSPTAPTRLSGRRWLRGRGCRLPELPVAGIVGRWTIRTRGRQSGPAQ